MCFGNFDIFDSKGGAIELIENIEDLFLRGHLNIDQCNR